MLGGLALTSGNDVFYQLLVANTNRFKHFRKTTQLRTSRYSVYFVKEDFIIFFSYK